jgi:hypothetical protein
MYHLLLGSTILIVGANKMSFTRFSETSDVYIYTHVDGYIHCCGCAIYGDYRAFSLKDILFHISEHRELGHKVPEGIEKKISDDVTDQDFKPLARDMFESDSERAFEGELPEEIDSETLEAKSVRLIREEAYEDIASRIEQAHHENLDPVLRWSPNCHNGTCTHIEDAAIARGEQ